MNDSFLSILLIVGMFLLAFWLFNTFAVPAIDSLPAELVPWRN